MKSAVLLSQLKAPGQRPGGPESDFLSAPNGDGDGINNAVEYGAGTDGVDPGDRPRSFLSLDDLTLLPSSSTNLRDRSFGPLEFLDASDLRGSRFGLRFRLTGPPDPARFLRLCDGSSPVTLPWTKRLPSLSPNNNSFLCIMKKSQTHPSLTHSGFRQHAATALMGCACLALQLLGSASCPAAEIKKETLEAYNQRMQWFADAQYGMFIHFGGYSLHGGTWKGEQVDGYSEWVLGNAKIDREEYARMALRFNPTQFNADLIVRNAKEAGMTYLVITAKHHEGFCLWDSAFTDYDVASTPFKGRDILQELKDACAKYGIRFGIYYSIIDWHHPSQVRPSELGRDDWSGKTLIVGDRKQEYVDYQRNQVLELLKKYDPAMLWFDGDWADWWTLDDGIQLYNAIREADADVIVNNRVAKRDGFELDFVTQEQKHFDAAFAKHWEGCYTINASWGYKKGDDQWKSPETVYNKLKDINEKGGALLLNVGPDGNGVVQDEAWDVLQKTAELLKQTPIRKKTPVISEVPGLRDINDKPDDTNIDGVKKTSETR